jgi:MFS family permease
MSESAGIGLGVSAAMIIVISLVFIFIKNWTKHLASGLLCLGGLIAGLSGSIAGAIATDYQTKDKMMWTASYGWMIFVVGVLTYIVWLIVEGAKAKKVEKKKEEEA